jgi:hypothetical protein
MLVFPSKVIPLNLYGISFSPSLRWIKVIAGQSCGMCPNPALVPGTRTNVYRIVNSRISPKLRFRQDSRLEERRFLRDGYAKERAKNRTALEKNGKHLPVYPDF